MPNYIPDYVERRERAAWDNATFGAIFQTLSDVFPPEKVETFPELGGPLFEVEAPEPYFELPHIA